LRERFGIDLRLSFYSPADLAKIIMRSANILGTPIDEDGAMMLAHSARGTPRIANRLLKRARDFANALHQDTITADIIKTTLFQLHIDASGLDAVDRDYMMTIIKHYAGGPVGIDNLAAALSEPADTIEDVIEPYLMQLGFIQRTPRGRVVTDMGYQHLGIEK
jgi:Holliday junction DNA helicase RuvB